MRRYDTSRENLIHRPLVFLVVRFVVFLLIALAADSASPLNLPMSLWAALGYFAVSEILLMVRSQEGVKQGIAIGIYFLDIYAVSMLILVQGSSILWYLTIPVLMLGVALCYHRRWAWLPIALIPSALLLYQAFRADSPSLVWDRGLAGIIALFFVFAFVMHRVIHQMDRVFSLYRAQRRLVQGIGSMPRAASLNAGMRRILEREAPVPVDFCSILLWNREGHLNGLEWLEEGGMSEVLLGSQRIPRELDSIKKKGTYFRHLPTQEKEAAYFHARPLGCLHGSPFQAGESKGLILFGRKEPAAFSTEEQNILVTYAEMITGWIRECSARERREVEEHHVSKTAVDRMEEGGERGSPAARTENIMQIQSLEQENIQLKKLLNEHAHSATVELNEKVLSLFTQETEQDDSVVDRLASLELRQAVSMLFDLDLVLDVVLDLICEKLSVKTAWILLLDEGDGELILHARKGLEDETVRKARLMMGEAVAGYAARKGEPLLIEDMTREPRFVPFRPDLFRAGTLLSLPILQEGNVLGVINLSDPLGQGPISEQDWGILQALCRQAAMAIANHRLYQGFENGQWIRDLYEGELCQRLSERVFREDQVLEKMEGEHRVSLLSVHIQGCRVSNGGSGVDQRIRQVEGCRQGIREIVCQRQGVVAGDHGAGVIGVFGLPFPDAEDPWRAVLAAVDLLKAFSGTRGSSALGAHNGLGISMGVSTGDLVLQEQRKMNCVPYRMFGEPWERAVTLMHAGSPGQILVDEATFERIADRAHGLRLVVPYGVHRSLTAYGLKGLKRNETNQ